MTKPETNIAQITKSLFDLLEPLDSAERRRVISATLMLFGENIEGNGSALHVPKVASTGITQQPSDNLSQRPSLTTPSDVQAYFDEKNPQSKIEEYAVAARFRELTAGQNTHTKDDFNEVIKSARRNFNDNKYS